MPASNLVIYARYSETAPTPTPTPTATPTAIPTAEPVYSGTCGSNLTWTLDTGTGLLEISGTGAMTNWDSIPAVPWYSYKDSVNTVQIGIGVTSIGDYAFDRCLSLTSVSIPNSVTSIGYGAFEDCGLLSYVTIPDGVTNIGSAAFSGCDSLISVTIPNGVTIIDSVTFFGCDSLTSVTIGNSVTSIGGLTFGNCTSLTNVTIPDSVTSIGNGAFYDCTSLISATFLGAPPSSIGTGIFNGCASDFCIYYIPAMSSEWAPNGETTWNGYPIAKLGNSSGKLLVKFMLNTGSGSTYTTQVVDPGERAYAPNNPRREGYTFRGWYSNPECTGQPWFNASNSFHGYPVYSNICLYAKWKPGFDIHEDWYSFNNSSDNFYHYLDQGLFYTPTYGKLITGEYKNALEKAFGSDKATLNGELDTKYNASCFGMSAVASLILANRITPSFFQSNCTTTFALKKPANNKAVRNLIEYYQILQSSPTTRIARTPDNTEEVNCKRVIDAIDSSNYPVVVGFNIYNWAGEKYDISGGHAVVACGYTLTDSAYRINIADPNRIGAFIHLDIERETYKNLGLDVTDYNNGTQRITFIKYALTVESLAYDHLNIQDYLTGKGYTSGAAARDIEDDVYTTLTTNFSSFRIDGSNGAYAVIEYGEKAEGNLDIGSGQCKNDIGSELQLEFTVPVLEAGESYTVTPAECLSVVTEEPLEEYHASLVCSGENGFWADSTTGCCAEFVFGSDGSVSTTCEEPCAQSATECRNDMTTDWSCVTVESAETAVLTAVPTCDSVVITADPDAEYDITVSSFHNDAVFEGIVGGSAGVTVTEDEHKNAVITYNESSDIAASGVFGCSLIFCTMGGSEIETQTGIVPGTTATAPEDPTRTGMLFGGWYTTYECEDGTEWSFDTPLTEDTYIYAKWEEDENYIHSVTFHIEDGFDTIYYVYNGEALTDYELPEIPEIVGYTASWPEIDLSCVTEDIVIEPIYTPTAAELFICGDDVLGSFDPLTGVLTISGDGAMYNYSSSSPAPWQDDLNGITAVVIEDGVTSIGNYAFYNCSSLTMITIPDSVTSIGDRAFYNCRALTFVIIPDGVTSIGNYAFYSCSSLTSVTIGNSVTSIGAYAFLYCSSLTSINVSADNQAYSSLDGVLFNKERSELIRYPSGKAGTYTIPDSVTSIGNSAFSHCHSFTSMTIPDSVTSIGKDAFSGCSSLTSVTIGNSVTNIGNFAFNNCLRLPSVTIPDSVSSIGYSAFYGCISLTSVTIGNGVTSIGDYAFKYCRLLSSVTFLCAPPSSFGSEVFDYCASDFCIYYHEEYASEWAPNGETTWKGYPICMIGGPDITPGDLDGNGEIDMSDISMLFSHLNGSGVQLSAEGLANADANGDGVVNVMDITAIFNMIANS